MLTALVPLILFLGFPRGFHDRILGGILEASRGSGWIQHRIGCRVSAMIARIGPLPYPVAVLPLPG